MRRTLQYFQGIVLATLVAQSRLWAAGGEASESWHAKSLGEALLYTALFGICGVAIAILGYKLFDKCTPGDLHREIIENKNTAAAIIAAAAILGVCIIIAAAML